MEKQYKQIQDEEFGTLKSIYMEDFKNNPVKSTAWNKLPPPRFQIFLKSHGDRDPTLSLILEVQMTSTYPLTIPIFKIITPKNVLASQIKSIEKTIHKKATQLKGQQMIFDIAEEIKELLDQYQDIAKTSSLEEERISRLKNKELQRQKELEKIEIQSQKNKELEKQYLKKMREDELKISNLSSLNNSKDDLKLLDQLKSNDSILLPPKDLIQNGSVKVFNKQIEIKNKYIKFQAVNNLILIKSSDLLSFGKQYIVKPYKYIKNATSSTFVVKDEELIFMLTEINLINKYWTTSSGKKEIEILEVELESVAKLKNNGLLSTHAVQIERIDYSTNPNQNSINNYYLKVKILTDYIPRGTLYDLLLTTNTINLKLARSWLIQLIEVVDFLQKSGHNHKALCLNSVYLGSNEGNFLPTIKLAHGCYGYRLIQMLNQHPNDLIDSENKVEIVLKNDINSVWKAPELQNRPKAQPQRKTDVWYLGCTFVQMISGINVYLNYSNPVQYLAAENLDSTVDEFLNKVFHKNPRKRLLPIECFTCTFLRNDFSMENENSFNALFSHNNKNLLSGTSSRQNSRRGSGYYLSSSSISSMPRYSRYQNDFEEVALLGRGAYGEVVKARNHLDGMFYAIKKIREQSLEDSFLTEVLLISRLNHQYVVRYYTAWMEEIPLYLDESAIETGSESDEDSDSSYKQKLKKPSAFNSRDNSFTLDFVSNSVQKPPSHAYSIGDQSFTDDSDQDFNSDDENSVEFDDNDSKYDHITFEEDKNKRVKGVILYIQMEYCEKKTLKDLIENEDLPRNSEKYWKLFTQILEGLEHIHSQNIIHRDLKPMNIFIDENENVKIGDFGLAKNVVHSGSNSGGFKQSLNLEDMTSDVGTVMYSANEVADGSTYNRKVDMYSLGIIFFEMVYKFSTAMERVRILRDLRTEKVVFPKSFNSKKLLVEKEIILSLLSHNPDERPDATTLLKSNKIPISKSLQHDTMRDILSKLTDPKAPWQQRVREAFFTQPYDIERDLRFDSIKDTHLSGFDFILKSQIIEEITKIFRLHGALESLIDTTVFPRSPLYDNQKIYEVLDKSGSLLQLRYDLTLPLAKLLSKKTLPIQKLFRCESVFRLNKAGGRPFTYKEIDFDIITIDSSGLPFNDAECLKVIDEIISKLPAFKMQNVSIILNHSDIIDSIFDHLSINPAKRSAVLQRLSILGISKNIDAIINELHSQLNISTSVLNDLKLYDFSIDVFNAKKRLHKIMVDSPSLNKIDNAFQYISKLLSYLKLFKIGMPVYISPLSNYGAKFYKGGIMFQIIYQTKEKRSKLMTKKVLAAGGRYDRLISNLAKSRNSRIISSHAVGFNLSWEVIFNVMKNYYKSNMRNFNLNQKSNNGSQLVPKRCDVLVLTDEFSLSIAPEVLTGLWENGISADLLRGCTTIDDIISAAKIDGTNNVVSIRHQQGSSTAQKSTYKPYRLKDLENGNENDYDIKTLISVLKSKIIPVRDEKKNVVQDDLSLSELSNSLHELDEPQMTTLLNKFETIVNDALKGRKNRGKVDKDLFKATSEVKTLFDELSKASVFIVDVRDSVVDMICITSLDLSEEWMRKVGGASNATYRGHLSNIYTALSREANRHGKWAIIYNSKTDKAAICDLQR
ncbi:serine/threonine-protein kinase GCN2 [Ascoidea rubescens DSM 1968]|uniref:non-specific serine/threonine protein kinase n=1 Tax=Ascoidea rubescens DSM 1968 TaxID=1344418 RepID=A0A1D2VE85_9ASCO|nr:Serine/threonine-protein kinase [Ascoidea rubescens DSM 1968]ODV59830.1 Serine/threonine-protein kinase [Ascoidea rubescens DSM 1968]